MLMKLTPLVNFINVKRANFFYLHFGFEQTFIQKNCTQNVDEIDTLGRFHHHFMSSFCGDILWPKEFEAKTVIREKLCKALLYE